jgi:hypothetical protein
MNVEIPFRLKSAGLEFYWVPVMDDPFAFISISLTSVTL